MGKPVLTKAFLQPAKGAAKCTAPNAETRPPPLQNLSPKQIAPTDNMGPGATSERWRKILWKWVVIEWILCWVDLFRKLLGKTENHILLPSSTTVAAEKGRPDISFFNVKAPEFDFICEINRCQDEIACFWRGWCGRTVSTASYKGDGRDPVG